jgi:hypothetical protein
MCAICNRLPCKAKSPRISPLLRGCAEIGLVLQPLREQNHGAEIEGAHSEGCAIMVPEFIVGSALFVAANASADRE